MTTKQERAIKSIRDHYLSVLAMQTFLIRLNNEAWKVCLKYFKKDIAAQQKEIKKILKRKSKVTKHGK